MGSLRKIVLLTFDRYTNSNVFDRGPTTDLWPFGIIFT